MKDEVFILWMPSGSRGKVVYSTRLFTPEQFFNTQQYEQYGYNAFIVQPDSGEAPKRLTKNRIQGMFPQYLGTAYARAALRGSR